ncbi:MAG: peptide chain release factor N(5)-glutamine methyltransferase [Candidatus Babeliales bacterium]
MTFDDIALQIAKKLQKNYADQMLLQQTSWWILEALLGEPKEKLIGQKSFGLTEEQEQTLAEWLTWLIDKKMPLQYLFGFVPFGDIEILVQPPILIPRPETEEWIYGLIQKLHTLSNQELTILDLCTGSGCIALALADALPTAHIYATDISKEALNLASHNAHHTGLINVTFLQSDLFETIPKNVQFDLIVANPPYIDEAEWKTLDPSVRDWEDKKALIADDHGYALIKKIIDEAPAFLNYNEELIYKKIENLWLEIGHQQGKTTKELLKKRGYATIAIQKDLSGKDRVAKASYANIIS